MITLNNKNTLKLADFKMLHEQKLQQNLISGKINYVGMHGKPMIKVPKGGNTSESPLQFSSLDHGQTKQNYTRQSPVEIPSSSNTSKQSNSQTATGNITTSQRSN